MDSSTGEVVAGPDVISRGFVYVRESENLMDDVKNVVRHEIGKCEEKGIKTIVIPGPTAFASALAISGLPTGRFTFEGFLSVNKKSRKEHLESLVNEERTMLFYEAPHKLSNTLKDFANYFPNRKLSIVREITKIHEEVIRTTTDKAYEDYGETGLKGEIVLVLGGKPHQEEEETYTLSDAVEMAKKLIKNGEKATTASKEIASLTGFKKNEIYKELL